MKNTSLVHIEKDGKYLMLHRIKKQNDINKDKWIGIGGKFLENESPEECALREAYEETGLTLKTLEYRGIVTFINDRCEGEYMHIFYSDSFSGTVKDCDEGVLEWIDKEKIFTLPIWEGDKIFLKLLDENTPFFSLKLVYSGDILKEAILNGKKL
jgi:8-oxo-dGTP diphosphatase